MIGPELGEEFNEEGPLALEVNEDDLQNFKRLDQFLHHHLPDYSRTYLKKIFQDGKVTAFDATKLELKKMPPLGTKVLIDFPPPEETELTAENIPLEIFYEDDDLVIINKPVGLVTHPAPGNWSGTLVNAILYHCPNMTGMHDEKRPGIVHRLDKGTSGVMVVAKNQWTHTELVKLFSTHTIERRYEAITLGPDIPPAQSLRTPFGRHPSQRLKMTSNSGPREAITDYRILKKEGRLHHLELKLHTGRTHQIRVHLSEKLRHPILCDSLYGNPKNQLSQVSNELRRLLIDYPHPLLHAKTLGFIHPRNQKEILIHSPPPSIFTEALKLGELL